MTDEGADALDARAQAEAAAWFARMRGPDGPRLTTELDDWRGRDPANAAAYDRLLRRWDQSAFLTNTALGRRRDLRRAKRWPHQPAARYAAGAAVLGVAVLGGVVALDRSRSPIASPTAPIVVTSKRGEIRAVRLADGSRVTLDTDSTIDLAFTARERRLRLDHGRVRIDAAADSARPLVVEAPGGSLFAGRSLFDLWAGQGGVEIALLRGTLDIAPNGAGKARHPLAVGRYIRLRPDGAMTAPRVSAPGQLLWTNGMVAFDGDRLGDAVEQINRYNDRRIVLGSADVADLRITGAFHVRDPDGFANAIAAMFDLAQNRADDGAIVLRKKSVG